MNLNVDWLRVTIYCDNWEVFITYIEYCMIKVKKER